jgi:hypothetical protein
VQAQEERRDARGDVARRPVAANNRGGIYKMENEKSYFSSASAYLF